MGLGPISPRLDLPNLPDHLPFGMTLEPSHHIIFMHKIVTALIGDHP